LYIEEFYLFIRKSKVDKTLKEKLLKKNEKIYIIVGYGNY